MTSTYTTSSDQALGALSGGVFTAYIIVCLVLGIFMIVCMWKLFVKAGEPGWGSIVPIYNSYLLFKVAMGNGWLFLLCLVPVVNMIISIVCYVKLASAYGKGGGFAVGLLFLPIIFLPILAFGDSEYVGA